MNLYLRLLWLFLAGRRRSRVPSLGPCRTPFRVSLADLDLLRHMNNGKYFSIMDIARVDMMRRSGFLRRMTEADMFPVVTMETLHFRKALNWRDHFEIETEVVWWDEQSVLLTQRFFRGSVEVATGLVRSRFLRRTGGSVPTAELLALLGESAAAPPMPAWLAAWSAQYGEGLPIQAVSEARAQPPA